MADIGNLHFGVHLKDYTDAEADKIKKKLESLSVKLNIDASSTKVSNTDSIKKQIEDAVKSIQIASVKMDASAVKKQVEDITKNTTPKITVSLLKGSLSNDIQAYLDTKSFKVKVSITASQAQQDIASTMNNVSVPVKIKVDSAFMLQQLQQSLSKRSVPISVRVSDVKSFVRDLESKMSKQPAKVGLDANWKVIRKSVQDALRGQTFTASLKLVVRTADVQDAIKQAFAKAGLRYDPLTGAAANANRNLANSYHQAANAADQFARASVTLSNGLHTNIRLGGQLGTLLGNFASVFGIKDLLRDVVAIGGQLENQRIALSSILQDGGKATTMFSKIQSLAVKSPFGIMDLNQYVKQLSAYQVPYNELYETMKRLADISAGVGVDMGRIILAFGQVKAAGFLKGTELRQFTEANIPMVKALADRFTELKGTIVSAAEVYDMISKKQITFEDVKSVLWDLTSEGGMFYGMQEVLSESLASKWKNLADAVDVMFGKIADGGIGSMLKGIAEGLTELTKNWEYVATAISTATVMFLAYKAAVVLGSKQIASANALYRNTLKDKRIEANNLRVAKTYRALTKAEQNLIATTNKLTIADLKQIIRSNELNKSKALQLIATKKLDRACIQYLQRLYGITDAQVRAATSSTWLKRATAQLGNGVRALGSALKGLFLNPWFLATTAITGLMEVFTYFSNKSQESAQRIKDSLQVATEGFRNLSDAVKETEGTPNTDAGLISGIEKMTTSLKDYAANSGEILSEIYKKDDSGDYVYDLEKRYELLKEKLLQTKDAYELLSTSMEGFTESANDATDGVFDESLIVNLKDLSESSSEYNKHLNQMTRNAISYKGAMEAAAKADKNFAEAIQGKDFREQIKLLKDYKDAANAFRNYLYENEHATVYGRFNQFEASFIKYGENLKVAEKDIEAFANAYKELLKGSGFDLNNLSEKQKIAIGVDLTGFIDKIEGLDEETKKLFYQQVLEKEFNINVTTKFNQGVNEERWRLELIKAAGGEKLEVEVEAMIKSASDYESVVEAVRTMYKDANEVVKDLNPVLLKAEVQFEAGKEVDEESVIFWGLDKETQKAVKEWNKAVRQIKAVQNIANDQGFLLTETKNRGGGGSKDPVAEMWKDRVAAIEKAVKMYDQWKQVEGKDKAESRVKGRDEFADLFSGKYGFKLDLEKPTAAYEYIQSLLDENKEKQKELIVNLGVKVSDAELADAKDELNNLLDALKRELDKKTSEWNLYKDLLKATGNKGLSMNIAFGGDIGFNTELDWLKSEIQKKLGDAFKFDDVIAMSGDQLKESGLANIEPLVEKYNEATKKLSQESIKNFIDILNASKDFAHKVSDLEEDLQRTLNTIYSQPLPYDEKKRLEAQAYKNFDEGMSKLNFEEFKKTSNWVKIFDDLDRVSASTLDEMIAKIEDFSEGGIESEQVLKDIIAALRKLREESLERNPFKGISDAAARLGDINAKISKATTDEEKEELKKERKSAYADMDKAMSHISTKFSNLSKAVGDVSSLLERFGNTSLTNFANFLDSMSSGMQSGMNIGSLFGGAGSVIGGFFGTAVGAMASLYEAGQKAVEAEQERSQVVIDRLEKINSILKDKISESLMGLYGATLDATSRMEMEDLKNKYDYSEEYFKKRGQIDPNSYYVALLDTAKTPWDTNDYLVYAKKTHDAINKALEMDNAYLATYANLLAQRDELYYQQANYTDKDEDKVKQYRRDKGVEIEKLNQEIRQVTTEMMSSLYSVDFKDWAGQFADSIVNAWANGESAAEAYGKTVGDVMRNVATSIVQQAIIGKYLQENLQDIIEMFEGKGGIMDNEMFDALLDLVDGLQVEQDKVETLLDGFEKAANKRGFSLKETDSTSKDGLSKGIQSVTESTADLLASYLNSLRGDVSVKRTLLEKLIADDIPQMSIIAQAQLTQLNNIAANTLRNADAADRIFDLVNRVVDKGNNKLKI